MMATSPSSTAPRRPVERLATTCGRRARGVTPREGRPGAPGGPLASHHAGCACDVSALSYDPHAPYRPIDAPPAMPQVVDKEFGMTSPVLDQMLSHLEFLGFEI